MAPLSDPTRCDEFRWSRSDYSGLIQPLTGGQYLRCVSSRGIWTDIALRAAWARADWAAVLYEYRRAAGLTQRQLEPLVGLPQPHISAIESRRRVVKTADVQARITEGLQVPQELIDAGQSAQYAAWEPSGELRERIAHAHAAGRTDLRTARWIERVLVEHRRAEDDQVGLDLWPVVRAQLDAVTRLIPGASGEAADQLLRLAGEHAHWLSWVAWQEGQRGAALTWIDLAYGWATDAGSADLGSWAQRVRAHYSLTAEDPVRALRTAEAARYAAPGLLSPAAESIAVHQAALAAAALSERDRARRLADEALGLAERMPDAEERPPWLYWLEPARARLHLADTAYACRDWQTAADLFRSALPDLAGYPRDHAHYQQRLEDAERRAA